MARMQATRRKTRKGSKKLTDAERVSQVMFQDPETLTEAERASQAMFKYPETIKCISKFQAARAKINEEEKADEIYDIRKQFGRLPRKRDKPEIPYEVDTPDEADMTEQAAAPAPGDTIEIVDDNNNDERSHGQDEDDENISLHRPVRLQGCENNPEED